MLKELDQDNPVTPAEKNTFRKSRPAKPPKPQRCCEMCTCNCPAMQKSPPKPSPLSLSESEQRCPLQEKLASQKKRLQAKLEKPVSGTYYALWCIFLLIHFYFFHFLALQGALGQGGSWRQALAESQGSGQHFHEVPGKISLCIKWIEKPINFMTVIDSENYYLLVIKDYSKIHKNLLKIVILIPLGMP